METTNSIPVKGLETIRKANIWSITAVVFAAIGGIILAFAQVRSANWAQHLQQLKSSNDIFTMAIIAGGVILTLASVVLILVARVRELLALGKLSKIHTGYKTALLLIVSSLVLSALVSLLYYNAVGKGITQVLNLLFVASVYFIINATVELLRNHGNDELATNGLRVCKLYVICNVVAVVAGVLALIPAIALVAGLIALVMSVLQFVALFKYIRFLGHAVTALKS